MMPNIRANIGGVRLALGILSLGGCILAGWFGALGKPLIYGVVVALLGIWIGLWPVAEPKPGRRLFIACIGSMGVCVVLVVISLAVTRIQLGGFDEGGPVLYAVVLVVLLGLPVMILAMIVAAIAPYLRARGLRPRG
jgi:hypothetical protein